MPLGAIPTKTTNEAAKTGPSRQFNHIKVSDTTIDNSGKESPCNKNQWRTISLVSWVIICILMAALIAVSVKVQHPSE